MKQFTYTLSIILIAGIITCSGQDFSMRNYNVRDGLPSSEVYKIIQDAKGYVWFATDAGISKFDGYTFKNFSTDDGMPDNTVLNICTDKNERLWFITYTGHFGYLQNDSVFKLEGSNFMSKQKKSIEIYSSLAVDAKGTLWIGANYGKGFYKITPPYAEKNVSLIEPLHSCSYVSFIEDDKIIYGGCSDKTTNKFDGRAVWLYSKESLSKSLETKNEIEDGIKCFLHPKGYLTCASAKKQFRVEQDQKLFIHRLNAELGEKVEFDRVLLIDNDGVVTVGSPVVEGAKIVVEVGNQVKGDKVIIFHKKRRKGYRKRNGHRQQFTEVTVKSIIA